MEKGLVRQILYKEGFKSVKIKETLGYDLTADNCLIEVKETKNLKYFNKNRYSYHSDEQKKLYSLGKVTILFICYQKGKIIYKFFNKYSETKEGMIKSRI